MYRRFYTECSTLLFSRCYSSSRVRGKGEDINRPQMIGAMSRCRCHPRHCQHPPGALGFAAILICSRLESRARGRAFAHFFATSQTTEYTPNERRKKSFASRGERELLHCCVPCPVLQKNTHTKQITTNNGATMVHDVHCARRQPTIKAKTKKKNKDGLSNKHTQQTR